MKSRIQAFAAILYLSLFIAAATLFPVALAHPIRTQQGLIATFRAAPPNKLDLKPDSALNHLGDEYKLVFAASFQLNIHFVGEEKSASRLKGFIGQLNKAGAQGYKLTSAVYYDRPVGLVRLAEGQREYTSFETINERPNEQGNELLKQGFRLADYYLFKDCVYTNYASDKERCDFEADDVFILERETDARKTIKHIVVNWGQRSEVAVAAEIRQKLDEGFYPTAVLSGYHIWLERRESGDEFWKGNPELQVVAYPTRHEKKRVNELAKEGYRLALTNLGTTLMTRHGQVAGGFSYVWLDTRKKDLEKTLAALQARGAVYRTADRTNDSTLIFEQKLLDDGKRNEFKVLEFQFAEFEDANHEVYVGLTASSKETINTLNRLVKEGFAVCDLFLAGHNADKFSVLLERSR